MTVVKQVGTHLAYDEFPATNLQFRTAAERIARESITK